MDVLSVTFGIRMGTGDSPQAFLPSDLPGFAFVLLAVFLSKAQILISI
jgi:hypothetical protein